MARAGAMATAKVKAKATRIFLKLSGDHSQVVAALSWARDVTGRATVKRARGP